MKKIKIISLFSGAGGLDSGFLMTRRFEIIFANDILTLAAETYSKNFGLKLEIFSEKDKVTQARPGVILACDVANIGFSVLSDEDVDIVMGVTLPGLFYCSRTKQTLYAVPLAEAKHTLKAILERCNILKRQR